MIILGISAYYHDAAAAILRDGGIVAAAQEERFSRKKHDPRFPVHAVRYCLDAAGVNLSGVDRVVFYDKPFLKFERLLETYVALAPRGFTSFRMAIPLWIKGKLFQRRLITEELRELDPGFRDAPGRILFTEHHQSHSASAFFPSPFAEAVVLTMDGVGEWATTSMGIGRGNTLTMLREIPFPHSLGLLYSAFTYHLGFKVNSGEYKVMGLAPYGEPRFARKILDHLIDVKSDGSFRLNLAFFDYCTGLKMTNERFTELFGLKPRRPDEPLTQTHMDLAASGQAVTEEVILKLTGSLAREFGLPNLCLAGGVALNCVANGKVLRAGNFKRLWIQPAAGDAGGALGAALAAYHIHLGGPRPEPAGGDAMRGAFLGPAYPQAEIEERLRRAGARFTVLDEDRLLAVCVGSLTAGKALGWFQGRMEFGPRALGARSILADPRPPDTQTTLNLRVKYRESFRPFAPAVPREDVSEWFELDEDSPYMLLVAPVRVDRRLPVPPGHAGLFGIERLKIPRSVIPAVTHVDYSARVQTVSAETHPRYHRLLKRFREATGCPVLVNTSFNVRGEPIVGSPEDAFRCFMGTEIEALAIGDCWLVKEEQNPALKEDYKARFEPD